MDLFKHPPYLRHKLMGARRGRHAAAAANKQRIVQQRAQPRQGIADGGLGAVETPACGGHVACLIQRLEHHQQVEIDVG